MEKIILMGQLDTGQAPDIIKTTLGSCVAVILYDPQSKIFGLAHVMLPKSHGDQEADPGKHVDTAIPLLLQKMNVPLGQTFRLKAKLTGGANMFPKVSGNPMMQIGKQNIQAAQEALRKLNIQVVSEDLGGTKGRQVIIDTKEEKILVNDIGSQPREL